jgi:maltooligosyltrehalose trehalohydrolase
MERAKVAIGIVMTSPFVPLLFQGEEFAASSPFQYFAHHEEPDMARAVSEGRKREFAAFGWKPEDVPDPERVETYERSKLRWDEVGAGYHAEMLEWYRTLITLRRGSVSLNGGDVFHVQVDYDEQGKWLVMKRGAIQVMTNLGSELVEFRKPEEFAPILVSHDDVQVTNDRIALRPNRLIILLHKSRHEATMESSLSHLNTSLGRTTPSR